MLENIAKVPWVYMASLKVNTTWEFGETPVAPLVGNSNVIAWSVLGLSAAFQQLGGTTSGSFTTGSDGSTGGGSGTNKITSSCLPPGASAT